MKEWKKIVLREMRWRSETISRQFDLDRALDQAYGFIRGVEVALHLEGEELDEMTKLWESFRCDMHPAYKADSYWREELAKLEAEIEAEWNERYGELV